MEVLAGLSAGPVSRLKNTWAQLTSNIFFFELRFFFTTLSCDGAHPTAFNSLFAAKKMALFQELNTLMENNFRVVREKIHVCQPPCIPYLGVYLSDLTFM